MIQKLGQVMVYVSDQEMVKKFWVEDIGFSVIYTSLLNDSGISTINRDEYVKKCD